MTQGHSVTEQSYIVPSRRINATLPYLARPIFTSSRAPSFTAIKRYAKVLASTYPEQSKLIKDIVGCVTYSHHKKSSIDEFYRMLIDLERYLIRTSY